MKKVISLAIAAALVAPVAAMADATVYGKVRVATNNISVDDNSNEDYDSWGMDDESSRLGIKGSEDLGNGLKAIYKMEFGVKTGDSFSGMSGRNAYVGLAGDFGTFLAGRHDTPLKMSTGKLDFFADTAADYDSANKLLDAEVGDAPYKGKGHTGLFEDRRVDGAIAYVSPSMAGLTLAGAVVQFDSTSDFMNAYSLAGMYGNGPWYASLAYEELEFSELANADDDESQLRLGLGMLDMAGFSAAIVYEERSAINGVEDYDTTAWQLSGAYKIGAGQIKAMYGMLEIDDTDDEYNTWAVGYQHNLSKRTDAQVLYNAREVDEADWEAGIFSVQLNHNF